MRRAIDKLTRILRAGYHLRICIFVGICCLRGSLAHAADDVSTLLDKAQAYASLVRTGHVKMEMALEIIPPTEKEARKIYGAAFAKDPSFEKSMMEWIRRGVARSAKSENLLFDNVRKAWERQDVDHPGPHAMSSYDSAIKSNMDKTVEIMKGVLFDKATHAKGNPHYQVRVMKTIWPPYWPYDMLMSCVWLKQLADASTPSR